MDITSTPMSKLNANQTEPGMQSASTTASTPLSICPVVFIGACSPEAGLSGLQAVQKPLSTLYKADTTNTKVTSSQIKTSFVNEVIKSGSEATLAVYSFGLKLIHFPGKDGPSVNIWFPISNLFVCAAVRYVGSVRRFVPLDLADADSSDEPPLFAAIFRQSRARNVTECFCFVCKNKQNAMDLVLACTNAYESFVSSKSPPVFQPDRRDSSEEEHAKNNENENTSHDCEYYGGYELPASADSLNTSSGCYVNSREIVDEGLPESLVPSQTEEGWQPILVRRVWLPASQLPANPMCCHNNSSTLENMSKKQLKKHFMKQLNESKKFASAEYIGNGIDSTLKSSPCFQPAKPNRCVVMGDKCQHCIQTLRTNCCSQPNQSVDRIVASPLSPRGKCYPEYFRYCHHDDLAINQMIRENNRSSATAMKNCHRQWSSQTNLNQALCVSRLPTAEPVPLSFNRESSFRSCQQVLPSEKQNGFVNKFRNLIFPNNVAKHRNSALKMNSCECNTDLLRGMLLAQQGQTANKMNSCQHNFTFDYSAVASDEADLLAAQADCYSITTNNTLARDPLPNEKAFMVSIRNQRHSLPSQTQQSSYNNKPTLNPPTDKESLTTMKVSSRHEEMQKRNSHHLNSGHNSRNVAHGQRYRLSENASKPKSNVMVHRR